MQEFKVVIIDSDKYKKKIIEFWGKYLQGTPIGRIDWLNKGNPAGKTIWYGVFHKDSGDLVATSTLMPKNLFMNSKVYKAGILGDVMVDLKYRKKGIAQMLESEILKLSKQKGFDFIYVVPNKNVSSLLKKVGYYNGEYFKILIRPINFGMYFPYKYRKILNFVNKVFSIFVKDTYINKDNNCFIGYKISDQKTDLNEYFLNQKDFLVGDRSPQFLNWRYENNHIQKFQFISYLQNKKLLGYISYLIQDNRLNIYDIVAIHSDPKILDQLIKEIILEAKKEKCKAIYLTISSSNPLYKYFFKFGFIYSGKYDILFSKPTKEFSQKYFFYNDRNI